VLAGAANERAPLSEPALNLLLNWGKWPAKTPQDSIRRQIETYLAGRGATDDELAEIWQADTPINGHTGGLKVSREQAIARTGPTRRTPKPGG
jgi:hypothetical protein